MLAAFEKLNFNKIETWQRLDPKTASLRLSYESDDQEKPNKETLALAPIICQIFLKREDWSQFCLNCEKNNLKGSKLNRAYTVICKKNVSLLATNVLKWDEAFTQALAKE